MAQILLYFFVTFSFVIPSVFGWLTASDGYNIGVALGSAFAALIFLAVMGFLIWYCCVRDLIRDYRRDQQTYDEKKGVAPGPMYKKRPPPKSSQKGYTVRGEEIGPPSKLSDESLQHSGGYYSGEGNGAQPEDYRAGSGGGSPIDYGAGAVDKYGRSTTAPGYGVGNRGYVPTERGDRGVRDKSYVPREMDSSTESRTSVRVAGPPRSTDYATGTRALVPFEDRDRDTTGARYDKTGYTPSYSATTKYSPRAGGNRSPYTTRAAETETSKYSPRTGGNRSPYTTRAAETETSTVVGRVPYGSRGHSPVATRTVETTEQIGGGRAGVVTTTTKTFASGSGPVIETTEQQRSGPGGATVTYKTTRTVQQRTVAQQQAVPAAYLGSSV